MKLFVINKRKTKEFLWYNRNKKICNIFIQKKIYPNKWVTFFINKKNIFDTTENITIQTDILSYTTIQIKNYWMQMETFITKLMEIIHHNFFYICT